MKSRILCIAIALPAWLLSPVTAETLALKKTFVQQVMNKATIAATLEVDVHPNTPHSISKGGDDGDIHMSGRAKEIGLPLVAEIVNARMEPSAMTALKASDPKKPVAVQGVWRIWFEHLGKEPQVQGKPVDVPDSSNPAHLFEIHPVSAFGDVSLLDSFQPIPKYNAYPAKTAFPFYEKASATIQSTATAVMIESGEGKYNYAEFVIQLTGAPKAVEDGFLVLANVFDSNSESLVTAAPRRMVFAKGTPPADEVKGLKKGDQLHLLGIPRVNLAEVFAIAQKSTTKASKVNLPYEMIVVAVLPD
jgi:hypothetical protein